MIEKKHNWKILVLCTYFSLGAFALISQTMMLREFFVVVYGNELVFGLLLTNWLLGIFTGALTGGALAERNKNNLMLFVMSILVMCILLPLSITLTRLLYTVSGTSAGTYIGFFKVFLYSALFIVPISFLIGFVFPIAARVQAQFRSHNFNNEVPKAEQVKGISTIYVFEAFGSLLSGVIYTFFFVGNVNSYMTAALIILPLLICSGLIVLKSRHYKTLSIVCILLIFNLVSLLPPVNRKFDAATVEMRWESVSTLSLAYSTDSKYQNIAVANLFNQYNLYLNTMFASAFPNDEDNLLLAAHLVCQHPGPQRILIIGDAVSGLAKALLRFDVKEVISVEIDSQTVDTVLKFLSKEEKNILTDNRFKILIRDGRKYVKDLIRYDNKPGDSSLRALGFDIVYVNVPEPSTLLLNRYYTQEFFADLSRIIMENGVVALKITSSENYQQGIVTDYTSSVFHTVRSVFPELVVAPGTQNFIFASNDSSTISDNPEKLAQRYSDTGVKPEKLGFIFYSLYPKEKTLSIKKALQLNSKPGINTDEIPIATLYFNRIIGWYSESNLSGILDFFQEVKLKDITMIILVLFLARLFYFCRGKKKSYDRHRFLKFHTLLAVFSSGMAGLSLELVILYTFQNNFGNIYHIIGFIIALFMFGLPLGAVSSNALLTREKLSDNRHIIAFIILIQVVLAGISLLLPRMTQLFAHVIITHQIGIFAQTILIGFAVGLVFPLALHLYLGKHEKTGKTAGIVDGFDHMGAAAGAFFIGTLFLPVMGVARVCSLVAFFPLITAVFLFSDIMRIKKSL